VLDSCCRHHNKQLYYHTERLLDSMKQVDRNNQPNILRCIKDWRHQMNRHNIRQGMDIELRFGFLLPDSRTQLDKNLNRKPLSNRMNFRIIREHMVLVQLSQRGKNNRLDKWRCTWLMLMYNYHNTQHYIYLCGEKMVRVSNKK
jgi:hypothetical protein